MTPFCRIQPMRDEALLKRHDAIRFLSGLMDVGSSAAPCRAVLRFDNERRCDHPQQMHGSAGASGAGLRCRARLLPGRRRLAAPLGAPAIEMRPKRIGEAGDEIIVQAIMGHRLGHSVEQQQALFFVLRSL